MHMYMEAFLTLIVKVLVLQFHSVFVCLARHAMPERARSEEHGFRTIEASQTN